MLRLLYLQGHGPAMQTAAGLTRHLPPASTPHSRRVGLAQAASPGAAAGTPGAKEFSSAQRPSGPGAWDREALGRIQVLQVILLSDSVPRRARRRAGPVVTPREPAPVWALGQLHRPLPPSPAKLSLTHSPLEAQLLVQLLGLIQVELWGGGRMGTDGVQSPSCQLTHPGPGSPRFRAELRPRGAWASPGTAGTARAQPDAPPEK